MERLLLLSCFVAGPFVVAGLKQRNSTQSALVATAKQAPTFQGWYMAHADGRGIWKWSNAIEAYDRHFSPWVGQSLLFVEVGVQSGGSLLMWQAVLGAQCYNYGLDINPQVQQFANAMTTISIGDQGDINMWRNFYPNVVLGKNIDMLVDDGGHEAHQMITTLTETFWHLNEGGYIAIEDIHGEHYVDSFFVPIAHHLGHYAANNALDSVHIYPFLLIVKRAGNVVGRPHSQLTFAGKQTVVQDFATLWSVLPANAGGHIVLQNAGWGPFLTKAGLSNFFRHFGQLHGGSWYDTPTGCQHTSAATCANTVVPTDMQAWITGVHVYPDRLIVEVAPARRSIQAVRKGTVWLEY